MTQQLLQSSTQDPLVFFMTDSADHLTGKTGLTVTVTLSKNGGSFASAAGAVAEIGSGWYRVAGNATDTNTLGHLLLHATATGADVTDMMYYVSATDPRASLPAAVWDRVLTGATHNIASSAGRRLREISGGIVWTGTAQAGSTNSITLDTGASSVNGTYDPAMIRIVSGTGSGQARLILDYTGSTRVAILDRDWRVAPDNTSVFEIVAAPNLLSTNEGLAQGGTSTSITLNSSASSINDTYKGQTVVLRTGTGQDQSRIISAYNGTTKVATVAQAWITTPGTASAYMILPTGRALMVSAEADSISAASLAADVTTELQSGLATSAALATVAGYIDTEVAAIKTQTDKLTFTVANVLDANIQRINDVAIVGNGVDPNKFGV